MEIRNGFPCPVSYIYCRLYSFQQKRACKWAAVRAALAVALIFGAAFAAFIAFCDFVWFL
jgi:hypothetical protein